MRFAAKSKTESLLVVVESDLLGAADGYYAICLFEFLGEKGIFDIGVQDGKVGSGAAKCGDGIGGLDERAEEAAE